MQNVKKYAPYVFLIFTVYLTTVWINFYYISSYNVDFNKYYPYINNLSGIEEKIEYGQNSFYYFLILSIVKSRVDIISTENFNIVLNNSIHIVNLSFYLIGLFGLFKFLKTYNFSSRNIIFSLSILSFFPQSIYLRSVMKPEIVAFALLTWLFYFLNIYIESRNIKYLYIIVFPLALILNVKASIAGMVTVYILIFYYKEIRNLGFKKIVIIFLILLSLFLVLQFENFQITNNLIYERAYDENYDNAASPSILFRLNIKQIFLEPFLKYEYGDISYSIHANSVLNISLLDTFGDHFDQLFDSDLNYFARNRKQFIESSQSNSLNQDRVFEYNGPFSQQISNNINHLRKTLSTIFSFIFFTLIIYFSKNDKKNRKVYLAPAIGILVLYINSLGFPTNNYSPFKGDTFKAFYYSFFLLISFSFLICKLITGNRRTLVKFVLIVFFIPSIFFIAGHPKTNNQNFSSYMVMTNDYSYFCEVNNFLFFNNDIIKAIHPSGNISNIKSNCKSTQALSDYNFSSNVNVHCFDENSDTKYSSDEENKNSDKCRVHYLKTVDNNNDLEAKIPYISILVWITSVVLFFKPIRYLLKFS